MHTSTILHSVATLTAFAVLTRPIHAFAAPPVNTARELGRVHWGHDLDKALAQSKASRTPVLLLFQEIPGCEGCVQFGGEPLSHPLLVEAIETQFVPVVIRNNVGGEEAKILKRFNEPAQNYPVMRFLDPDGSDVISRLDNIFTTHDVSKRLIQALATSGGDVHPYLELVMVESDTSRDNREKLTFAMHCFWDGEADLGAIRGVVSTHAAYYDKQEAVDVVFDPKIVSIEELATAADKAGCADTVYAHGDVQLVYAQRALGQCAQGAKLTTKSAPASDQHYSLAQSPLRYLPMTPMQAMKVNSALRLNTDVNEYLSPQQVALAKQIEAALAKNPKALDGLKPSDSVEGMAAYTDALRLRVK